MNPLKQDCLSYWFESLLFRMFIFFINEIKIVCSVLVYIFEYA